MNITTQLVKLFSKKKELRDHKMDDSCLDKKTKSAVQNIVLKKTLGKLHRKLSFQMSSSKILKIVY